MVVRMKLGWRRNRHLPRWSSLSGWWYWWIIRWSLSTMCHWSVFNVWRYNRIGHYRCIWWYWNGVGSGKRIVRIIWWFLWWVHLIIIITRCVTIMWLWWWLKWCVKRIIIRWKAWRWCLWMIWHRFIRWLRMRRWWWCVELFRIVRHIVVITARWKTRWRVDVGVVLWWLLLFCIHRNLAIIVPKQNGWPLTRNQLWQILRMKS